MILSARAEDTIQEAKEVQEEARRLAEEAKRGQENIDKGEVKRRIEKLYIAENTTNDLLKQAKEANETAHYAIINGTKTLAEAEKNLKILEVCGNQVLFSSGTNSSNNNKKQYCCC